MQKKLAGRVKLFMAFALMAALASSPAMAETAWVSFQAGAVAVKTLIALPQGPGPHAAVIYNHGTVVREKGYEEARDGGYDAADFVEALADAGYIGLAPVRDHLASADYKTAVTGGVETVKAAIRYLKSRSDVDTPRIGAIGFSEGGLVTLWSAIEGAEFRAVVLMSPATMRDAGDKQLKTAARKSNLQRLTMPVLLTVGADDLRSIRRVTARRLIVNMKSLGKRFSYKTDYPGDHRWFTEVRADYFGDVKAFLDEHLK